MDFIPSKNIHVTNILKNINKMIHTHMIKRKHGFHMSKIKEVVRYYLEEGMEGKGFFLLGKETGKREVKRFV